ncbi:hypothetical protein AB0I91_31730 [Actinosynnema sp. NPDC049800]
MTARAELERLARQARDELAAAGLPLSHEGLAPDLQCGVTVRVTMWEPDDGVVHADWRPSPRLSRVAVDALRHKHLDHPALHQQGAVSQAMADAVITILTAAGFTARHTTNDYLPYGVDVLAAPEGPPAWAVHDDELTMPGWSG